MSCNAVYDMMHLGSGTGWLARWPARAGGACYLPNSGKCCAGGWILTLMEIGDIRTFMETRMEGCGGVSGVCLLGCCCGRLGCLWLLVSDDCI
ncbi:hypothetical protein ASPBRDRAFT_40030 [Aspergillus brasiliensis CBS 101740]|uniref:Uncharacterized protein n=1 Tax=Aspergillus brasiliensis (strain CBS 101740 / IMI 381727 / IBT 21946) TaxID=767769 RepID=A0A1L9UT94_ASPBC|nr:hypothetical protein ASPBRDRAFT_40030 [Aspergillus brasiliensis CBS 101740]